jgi:hypothetical protein
LKRGNLLDRSSAVVFQAKKKSLELLGACLFETLTCPHE